MITRSCCACKSSYGAAYGYFYFLICSCYLGNRKSFFHSNLRKAMANHLSTSGEKKSGLNYCYIYYLFMSPKPERTHLTMAGDGQAFDEVSCFHSSPAY